LTEYCKTLFFRCILILRFSRVEISLHFNFVDFPELLIFYADKLMVMGSSKNSWVFIFFSRFYSNCENL